MSAPVADPGVMVFLAWSRVWSPLLDDAVREEAWTQLELPVAFAGTRSTFLRAFQVALPQPPAPLLLHAALAQDGGSVREDFVRVMDWLELDYDEAGRLPPDHLACACELYALALHLGEDLLARGLRERYLLPWAQAVAPALAEEPAMRELVARFAADLAA